METFDAIYGRRAVKHFDPDHEMTDAEKTKLLEAAIQAPTSFNIQHWRFVVVDDPELRKQIREVGNDQAQITDASEQMCHGQMKPLSCDRLSGCHISARTMADR